MVTLSSLEVNSDNKVQSLRRWTTSGENWPAAVLFIVYLFNVRRAEEHLGEERPNTNDGEQLNASVPPHPPRTSQVSKRSEQQQQRPSSLKHYQLLR